MVVSKLSDDPVAKQCNWAGYHESALELENEHPDLTRDSHFMDLLLTEGSTNKLSYFLKSDQPATYLRQTCDIVVWQGMTPNSDLFEGGSPSF